MGIALHPYLVGQPHRLRALRVALVENAFLEMENERLTRQASTGYARGRMPAKKT